jgi:hypothetical protein
MRITGDADGRFVSALRAELARRHACERAYRLQLAPSRVEREGHQLRFRTRVTVLRANGDLRGEVPVSVAVPYADKSDEQRLLDAAGRRGAELFTANFR